MRSHQHLGRWLCVLMLFNAGLLLFGAIRVNSQEYLHFLERGVRGDSHPSIIEMVPPGLFDYFCASCLVVALIVGFLFERALRLSRMGAADFTIRQSLVRWERIMKALTCLFAVLLMVRFCSEEYERYDWLFSIEPRAARVWYFERMDPVILSSLICGILTLYILLLGYLLCRPMPTDEKPRKGG